MFVECLIIQAILLTDAQATIFFFTGCIWLKQRYNKTNIYIYKYVTGAAYEQSGSNKPHLFKWAKFCATGLLSLDLTNSARSLAFKKTVVIHPLFPKINEHLHRSNIIFVSFFKVLSIFS